MKTSEYLMQKYGVSEITSESLVKVGSLSLYIYIYWKDKQNQIVHSNV